MHNCPHYHLHNRKFVCLEEHKATVSWREQKNLEQELGNILPSASPLPAINEVCAVLKHSELKQGKIVNKALQNIILSIFQVNMSNGATVLEK